MSGICAVWRRDKEESAAELLSLLTRGLVSGDSERVDRMCDGQAGIGLAARTSTQQAYCDAGVLVACDAQLNGTAALHSELGLAPGNVAALLGRMYVEWGPEFASRLDGAFSVVIWDLRNRKLVCATDRFGIKRLAFCQNARGVMAATRVDALTGAGADPAVNPRAIANLLNFSAILAPDTIFKSVERLEPGMVLVAGGELRRHRYWDMRYPGNGGSERSLSAKLEAVFEDSVARHCEGTNWEEVGAFLSGGTDSSTVVGMMSRAARGPVKAFSIGFEEQRFNELGYAELAAAHFKSEHHTHLVGADDCFRAIPELVRCFDEPFCNSSAVPTYFCARLAAETGVRTLLAGDGGDELFGGNERYLTDKVFELYQEVPALLRKGVIEPVLARIPMQNGLAGRARGYIRRSNMPGVERLLSFQFLATHPPASIFDPGFVEALGSASFVDIPAAHYAAAGARDHLDRLLYVDLKITLADNDLPKVTTTSELAGIEPRFPFLDRRVAELSGSIPARLKVKGFNKRYLFKRAFRNLLPAEIIRKKKHGFGIPVATWLKTDPRMRELARDTLLSSQAIERGYFRRDLFETMFKHHEADDSSYYGDAIWGLLMLELWHRRIAGAHLRVGA